MFTVVIPNRFPEVIKPLLVSINNKIHSKPPIVIIMDGHTNNYGYSGFPYNEEHFCYSRAVNIGIKTFPQEDIILMNDDCQILEWDFFNRLSQLAYADPYCGILSPLIVGCAGNEYQRWHEMVRFWTPDMDFVEVKDPSTVCFPCVYIKRAVFNHVGFLNETKASYGMEDVEYCAKVRRVGWKTMITQRILVQHADGSPALGEGRGKSWATSFMKRWPGTGVPSNQEIDGYLRRTLRK
jgi:GT2 family glycosyltransferase